MTYKPSSLEERRRLAGLNHDRAVYAFHNPEALASSVEAARDRLSAAVEADPTLSALVGHLARPAVTFPEAQ